MADETPRDIRRLPPEEHWTHFARSWRALKSYTYCGKQTPHMDAGVTEETMPLRHDMRNAGGGIMAAPLCILAPEPYWRDDECVPAPVSMNYHILDPARDVARLLVEREVIHVGRRMGFSRSRIVDYHDRGRVIAVSSGSGVSLGDVPPGFEPVDNPVEAIADSPDLPPLRTAFGIEPTGDGAFAIARVTPDIASPHGALHLGPIAVALEAAAMDALQRATGSAAHQAESLAMLMVGPGHVGPFVASARLANAPGGRMAVEATLIDTGAGDRTVATANFAFRRAG